jgi:GTP-dependent phosphoenolpyruvate carboxykinase
MCFSHKPRPKWVFKRHNGNATAYKTAIGNLPTTDSLETSSLNFQGEI